MAKASPVFANFTAGELSPRLDGRTDLDKYFNGCKQLRNFITHPHGGASRRPGTLFVNEVKNSANNARLIPFEFNVEQAYILEFGDQYFRIHKDGGTVVAGLITYSSVSGGPFTAGETITGGTSSATAVVIEDDATDELQVRTISGTFQAAETITGGTSSATATLDSIDLNGGDPIEVTTPYLHTELSSIKFTQSADVMYMVHPDHPVQKITRTGHDTWTITEVSFRRGPLQDPRFDGTSLLANGRSGSVTLTASGGDVFESDDVGRIVKVHSGYAEISAFSSATSVTATVVENEDGREELMPSYTASTISFFEGDPDNTGLEHNDRINDTAGQFLEQGFKPGMKISISGAAAGNNGSGLLIVTVTADTILISPSGDLVNQAAGSSITITGDLEADDSYQLGAFSAKTGYPAAVAFYEQRLVFANTLEQPQTIFFSQGGDFENFTQGTDDASALVYTIGSNQVNVIQYLSSGRSLLVGTSGGEFAVSASGTTEPLTPKNAQIKKQSSYGSTTTQPVLVGNVTLFIQRAKRKVRELVYDFDSDSYLAPDLTLLAEHITESGIKEIAFQQEPDNIVWCVLEDGRFVGMTYRREEQVVAWHEHLLGGTSSVGGTDYDYGFVESVASIPGDLDEDTVYIVVNRQVNGGTVRHVEYFNVFDFGDNILDAHFLDSGLQYSGSAVSSVSGLSHLEGETVSILADGSAHADKVVSSGSVTLDRAASDIHIGLPYTSRLQTMRIDAGGTEGTSQGKTKRVRDVTLRLYRSIGAKVGPDQAILDVIPFRSSAAAMDQAVPLFTGDKTIEFDGDYDTEAFIVVEQVQPLPMTVLAIYPRLQTFDR